MRLIRMLIFAIASQDVDHRFRKRDRKDGAGVGHDSQHFEDRAAHATKVDAAAISNRKTAVVKIFDPLLV